MHAFNLLVLVGVVVGYPSLQYLQERKWREEDVLDLFKNSLEGRRALLIDPSKLRLVEILPSGTCRFYGRRDTIDELLEKNPDDVWPTSDDLLNVIIEACAQHMHSNPEAYISPESDLFKANFVLPDEDLETEEDSIADTQVLGTKWCGNGDIAENYEDLGVFAATDLCCREHDYCQDIIESGQTKHNLTNEKPFTISNCTCDYEFRECLMSSVDAVADVVGITFFNVLGGTCFKLAHPIVACIKNGGLFDMYCAEYELDETKPKTWQFFENPEFDKPQSRCESGKGGIICQKQKKANQKANQKANKLYQRIQSMHDEVMP